MAENDSSAPPLDAQLPPEIQQLRALLKADIQTTVQPMFDAAVQSVIESTAAQFERQGEQIASLDERVDRLHKEVSSIRDDVDDLKATTSRIENKLDATIDRVDDHEVRLKRLKPRTL